MATPRQYRPTYEHNFRNPPPVRSTSGLVNFPPSPPLVKIKNEPIPRTYEERRTTSIFPKPIPAYSAPTTARTGLTVSASLGDLSRSSNMVSRLRLPNLRRVTPTRIPSPITDMSSQTTVTPRRYVSTPVIGSTRKQNVETKAHSLLRPISPSTTQPVYSMPKSKTMGMLSNLSNFSLSHTTLAGSRNSSFSRSTAYFSSRKSSGYSSQTAEPTISECNSTPSPPPFTTHAHQISGPQSNSYWCGRFQSVHDRFHLDNLEVTGLPQEEFRKYVSLGGDYKRKAARRKLKSKKSSLGIDDDTDTSTLPLNSSPGVPIFIMEDEENRCKRVFAHLEVLCLTADAKKSLWEFQQRYARKVKCESLLPAGGTMVDSKEGWMARMGRAIKGTSDGAKASRTNPGFGRRSGLAAFGVNRQDKV